MITREVALKTADFLEQHPDRFRFTNPDVPGDDGCGTTGCVLGWLHYFAGVGGSRREIIVSHAIEPPPDLPGRVTIVATYMTLLNAINAREVVGMEEMAFYDNMDVALEEVDAGENWRHAGHSAAQTLRAWTDKHLPAPRDELQSIRHLFEVEGLAEAA